MTRYEAKIKMNPNGGFLAYVVQIDKDGQERVDNVFGMKFYKTRKAAETQTAKYISRI